MHLEAKISDGPDAIFAYCPDEKCNMIVPESLFKKLVTPEKYEKYQYYLFKSFIDLTGTAKWCTGPSCD